MTGPQTLPPWLAALRRKGLRCTLHGGRVRVSGLRRLSPAERDALFAAAPQVQALLEARAQRRRTDSKKEQQKSKAMTQHGRKVVGQHVVPGYPQLSRLLYDDEVRKIPERPGRLLGAPYGWRK